MTFYDTEKDMTTFQSIMSCMGNDLRSQGLESGWLLRKTLFIMGR